MSWGAVGGRTAESVNRRDQPHPITKDNDLKSEWNEITKSQWLDWCAKAKPKERIIYGTGAHAALVLRNDKGTESPSLAIRHDAAQRAWDAYEQGFCILVQQRQGPHRYDYIAQRRQG